MRTLLALPLSRSSAMLAWGLPALFVVLASSALSGGITALVWQQRGELHDVFTGSAATILVLTGFVQAAIAWRGARRAWDRQVTRARLTGSAGQKVSKAMLVRRLFVGLVLCYLMAASTGSSTGAPCVFAAAAMVWLTAALLPLTAHPTTIDSWRRLTQGQGQRRAARILYLGLLCGVLGELSLRAGGWLWETLAADESEPIEVTVAGYPETATGALSGRPLSPASLHLVASPASAASGDGQQLAVAGSFERNYKVAVMGDEISLLTANPGGALEQMEAALPGVKVFDLSAAQAGPREYARNQIHRVRKVSPNLALAFVSVGDDIMADPPRADLFDLRSLSVSRLTRRYLGWPQAQPAMRSAAPRHDDWETYVAACGPQLAVCRKPIDAAMQCRWKTTLGYLDELEQGCREAGIPLALVIVPSPLQINRPLLEAACRRQGYLSSEIDLELPQRRLAAYAAERKLAAFDLLPALRLCPEQPFVHQGWRWSDGGNAAAAEALTGWLQTTFTGPYATARQHDQQHAAVTAESVLIARKP